MASDINYQDLEVSAQLSSIVYCEDREGNQAECSKDYTINGEPLSINWFTSSDIKSKHANTTDNSQVNNFYNQNSSFWRELDEATLNSSYTLNDSPQYDYFQTLTIYDPTKNTVYIAFRGSDNLINWIGNIQLSPTPFENDSSTMVHFGFYHYLLSSLAAKTSDSNISLQDWLAQIEVKYKPNYVITGHSLGGAGAVLLGAKFIKTGLPADRIKLITYGQPAVGTWGFLSKYQSKITNYVRVANIGNPDYMSAIMGDPVVSATAILKYYQFGKVYNIAIDTNYSIYNKIPDYPESVKYPLSLHDSFNYTDFIMGCNILSETCSPQLRKTDIPHI